MTMVGRSPRAPRLRGGEESGSGAEVKVAHEREFPEASRKIMSRGTAVAAVAKQDSPLYPVHFGKLDRK